MKIMQYIFVLLLLSVTTLKLQGMHPSKEKELTPLMIAAKYGEENKATACLLNGADARALSSEGCCALDYAAYYGHDNIVKLLLKEGKLSQEDKNRALRMATCRPSYIAGRDCEPVVATLLEANADVNGMDEKFEPPIFWATIQTKHQIMQLLMNAKADPSLGRNVLSIIESSSRSTKEHLLAILKQNSK